MRAAFQEGDLMRTKTSVGLCLGFVALVAWALPACGDDDDNGGSGGGGGASGSSGASGASGAAGSEFVCKTPGTSATENACVGQEVAVKGCYEADGAPVDCDVDGGTGKSITELTTECAKTNTCLGKTDPAENIACVNECVQAVVKGAVSEDCTACAALSANCAKENCIKYCLVDTGKCEPCRCECECVAAYDKCSGVPGSSTCS
jgi:hypothetical protein